MDHNKLTPEKIADARKEFNKYDKDGSGQVDLKELAYIFNVVKGSHLPKDSNPEKRTNWSKMTVFDVKKGSQEKVTGIFVKICSS